MVGCWDGGRPRVFVGTYVRTGGRGYKGTWVLGYLDCGISFCFVAQIYISMSE